MNLFITIVAALPAMAIYGSYSTLQPYVMFDNLMLGNMGGASYACAQTPQAIAGAVLQLSCSAGAIQTNAVVSSGELAF